jgi:hypothetical protein
LGDSISYFVTGKKAADKKKAGRGWERPFGRL